jgi:hypothetical protein
MHWMMFDDRYVLFLKLILSLIAFVGGGILGLFCAIAFAALHCKVKSMLLLPGGAAGAFLGFWGIVFLTDPHPQNDFVLILGPFLGACFLIGTTAWATRTRR